MKKRRRRIWCFLKQTESQNRITTPLCFGFYGWKKEEEYGEDVQSESFSDWYVKIESQRTQNLCSWRCSVRRGFGHRFRWKSLTQTGFSIHGGAQRVWWRWVQWLWRRHFWFDERDLVTPWLRDGTRGKKSLLMKIGFERTDPDGDDASVTSDVNRAHREEGEEEKKLSRLGFIKLGKWFWKSIVNRKRRENKSFCIFLLYLFGNRTICV